MNAEQIPDDDKILVDHLNQELIGTEVNGELNGKESTAKITLVKLCRIGWIKIFAKTSEGQNLIVSMEINV